jgi:hypothetical protein
MESYISKICPFCKAEITEADAVKVCPACGTPHHEGCWEENHGCSTPGCSEEYHEEQNANSTEVCASISAPLEEAQEASFEQVQEPALEVDSSAANQIIEDSSVKKKSRKGIIAAVIAGVAGIAVLISAIVAVVIAGALFIPKAMVSVEDLCAEGKYLEAYEKAEGDEKLDVLAENMIAVLSQETSDKLKNPDSFNLRDAWYYGFLHRSDGAMGGYAILYSTGTNSYGGTVSAYFVYTLGKDGEWNYVGSVDASYDEDDDDLADALTKIVIREGKEKGKQLTKEQVKRINAQFEAETLYKVEAIDWDVVNTSGFEKA